MRNASLRDGTRACEESRLLRSNESARSRNGAARRGNTGESEIDGKNKDDDGVR